MGGVSDMLRICVTTKDNKNINLTWYSSNLKQKDKTPPCDKVGSFASMEGY